MPPIGAEKPLFFQCAFWLQPQISCISSLLLTLSISHRPHDLLSWHLVFKLTGKIMPAVISVTPQIRSGPCAMIPWATRGLQITRFACRVLEGISALL